MSRRCPYETRDAIGCSRGCGVKVSTQLPRTIYSEKAGTCPGYVLRGPSSRGNAIASSAQSLWFLQMTIAFHLQIHGQAAYQLRHFVPQPLVSALRLRCPHQGHHTVYLLDTHWLYHEHRSNVTRVALSVICWLYAGKTGNSKYNQRISQFPATSEICLTYNVAATR